MLPLAILPQKASLALPLGCTTRPLSVVREEGPSAARRDRANSPSSTWTATRPIWAKILTTQGKGGGYTQAGPGGHFIYSLQELPREGPKTGDKACQIGQLAVVDAKAEAVVAQLPLGYTGPACTQMLAGSDKETANPGHMHITDDGKRALLSIGGGFGKADARIRKTVVVDLTDPTKPVQLPSIAAGLATSHRGDACSADSKVYVVANNAEASVTRVDTQTLSVQHIPTGSKPLTLAT